MKVGCPSKATPTVIGPHAMNGGISIVKQLSRKRDVLVIPKGQRSNKASSLPSKKFETIIKFHGCAGMIGRGGPTK